jgi:hypothetical protein
MRGWKGLVDASAFLDVTPVNFEQLLRFGEGSLMNGLVLGPRLVPGVLV